MKKKKQKKKPDPNEEGKLVYFKLHVRKTSKFLNGISDVCACMHVQLLSHVQLLEIPDYSLPGSSVHGILQARILTHAAIFSSRGSSQPRDWTCISCVSCIGRWVLYHWATWKVQVSNYFPSNAFIYRINSSDGLNLSRIISRLVHRISRTLEIFWKLKKNFFERCF